jgi:hypothetical protein
VEKSSNEIAKLEITIKKVYQRLSAVSFFWRETLRRSLHCRIKFTKKTSKNFSDNLIDIAENLLAGLAVGLG